MLGNTGDELANMWGLITAGIALAGIGLTLSDRVYRYALFVGAAGFLVCGLAWAPIRGAAPELARVMTALTSNPSNWFLIAVIVVMALWLHEWRKETLGAGRQERENSSGKNRSSAELPTPDAQTARRELNWKRPDIVLREFDKELAEYFSELEQEFILATQTYGDLVRRSQSFAADKADPLTNEEYADVLSSRTDAGKQLENVKNRIINANREGLEHLRATLESGGYITQGFIKDAPGDASVVTIPNEQWRLLRFDQNSTGYERAKGHGLDYIAIRIAKAEP